ncbi:MAG: hypothetical protein JW919_07500 [Candidatus Omnitrophica bacterium]|nr:hypothetical protein [Candidatus Omnitrophota bacterium]
MEAKKVRIMLVSLVAIIVALFGASFYMNYETIKLIENGTVAVDNLIKQKDAVIEKLGELVDEKDRELDRLRREIEDMRKGEVK